MNGPVEAAWTAVDGLDDGPGAFTQPPAGEARDSAVRRMVGLLEVLADDATLVELGDILQRRKGWRGRLAQLAVGFLLEQHRGDGELMTLEEIGRATGLSRDQVRAAICPPCGDLTVPILVDAARQPVDRRGKGTTSGWRIRPSYAEASRYAVDWLDSTVGDVTNLTAFLGAMRARFGRVPAGLTDAVSELYEVVRGEDES